MVAGEAVLVAPAPVLAARARRFARPQLGRSLTQLGVTVAGYAGGWIFAVWSAHAAPPLLPLAVVTIAAFGVRLFILQHDCGHTSLLPSRGANELVGSVLGVLTLAPYHYWRRTHAQHHSSANNLDRRGLGYMKLLTVDEYRALSERDRRGYRLYRNPWFLVGFGVPFQWILKHRWPWDLPRSWRREWASVIATDVALLAVAGIAHATIGLGLFFAIQLPALIVEAWIGGWLFWVQHTFHGAWHRRDRDWGATEAALDGSSWFDLPAILHWFTGHIGLHHVHHLDARIPNYRLREALDDVPGLAGIPRISLRESFATGRLALYDEEAARLVGFDEVAG